MIAITSSDKSFEDKILTKSLHTASKFIIRRMKAFRNI